MLHREARMADPGEPTGSGSKDSGEARALRHLAVPDPVRRRAARSARRAADHRITGKRWPSTGT